MNVVHLNSFGRYSTGNIAGGILSTLPESDGKLLIYALEDSDYSFAKKINNKFEAFFHYAFNRLFGRHCRYSYFNTLKIIKTIKKEKPDILHLHNLHGYYMDYVPLFKYIKKNNVKVVWTLHDCWPFTGFCYHFDRIGCEKWKKSCEKCPANYKEGYLKSYFFDTSKPEYKNKKKAFCSVEDMTIVCPSNWLANLVKQSFLGEYNIKVINNGINLSKFNYTDNNTFDDILDRNKKIVLGVAYPFDNRKGYSDFIKLSRLLTDDYQIVLVGLEDEQIASLPNNMVGIRKTKNQVELAELYSVATVFVNMTYEDNFPTVNIEALSCGTPVITYNTGGSVECIRNNNGLIVPQGDVEKMKDSILKLQDMVIDREAISLDAKSKYSKEVMTEQYIKLYKGELK